MIFFLSLNILEWAGSPSGAGVVYSHDSHEKCQRPLLTVDDFLISSFAFVLSQQRSFSSSKEHEWKKYQWKSGTGLCRPSLM